MSIVEPNVLELLENTERSDLKLNRYDLVVAAARRGRQIIDGQQPLMDAQGMKPLKIGIEEMNRKLLNIERPDLSDEEASDGMAGQ